MPWQIPFKAARQDTISVHEVEIVKQEPRQPKAKESFHLATGTVPGSTNHLFPCATLSAVYVRLHTLIRTTSFNRNQTCIEQVQIWSPYSYVNTGFFSYLFSD